MKKTLYIFIFLAISKLFCGQVMFSYVGFGDEKKVLKEFEKSSVDKENIINGYTANQTKNGDTLIIKFIGPKTTIRKMTFKGWQNSCDFDQILLPLCDSCTKYQIEIILNDKRMHWKKISENKYLSNYFWQTELALTYNSSNYCTILTFKELILDKKEYNKLRGDN